LVYSDFDLKEQSKQDESKVYRIGDLANFNKGKATISVLSKMYPLVKQLVGLPWWMKIRQREVSPTLLGDINWTEQEAIG